MDLVRFDVRVTDSAGRPVIDLRPQEIEILEGGQVRPLLQFQHITEPAGAYADAALRAVSAEVTSNQGTPRGHLYLLVFDQNHITSGNEQVARRAAETFIKTRLRPSDRIAIVGLPGPGPDIGFTADRNRALTALQRVHGALERNVSTAAGRLSVEEAYEISNGNDQAITNVLTRQSVDLTADVGSSQSSGLSGLVDRAASRQTESSAVSRQVIQENARTLVAQTDADSRQFLQRLADLIEQYRTIEGRKTLILFSEGFHQQNVTREVEQVAASAAQSYAVVYAFDMNRHRSELDQPLMPATNQATEILVRSEPLGSLAAETDGVLLRDAAEQLDKALNQIADQSQDYYLVGFEPSEAATANRGQYRRVSVRVTREGTHVSARTGYAVPRDSAPLDRRRAIDFALAAPFVQQGLRVGYTTYTMRSDTTGRAQSRARTRSRPAGAGRRSRFGRRRVRGARCARWTRCGKRNRYHAVAGAGRSWRVCGRCDIPCSVRADTWDLSDAHGRARAGWNHWECGPAAGGPAVLWARRLRQRSCARLRDRIAARPRPGVFRRRVGRNARSLRTRRRPAAAALDHGVLVPAWIRSTRRNRAGNVVRARGCRRRRSFDG